MGLNKFITKKGRVLLDLSEDSVTPETLPKGITAHDRSGEPIVGKMEVVEEVPTQEKTVDVTDNGTVVIEPDEGHTMTKVTANVNVPKDGVDKIQRYIELQGNSAEYLFYNYLGATVDGLMDGVDTSTVTKMSHMFANSKVLTAAPLFDTSKVTNMSNMFMYCSNLTTVPLFDTSNVTNMSAMFSYCSNLTTVPLFDTSNVTNMNSMLGTCKALTTVPLFDTSKVTNMEGMIRSCRALTTVPLFDTSKVTRFASMFYDCVALTTVPLFDTSKGSAMDYMFYNCKALTTVPSLDMRGIGYSSAASMFHQCESLTEIWIRNIRANLQVGSGTSYGHLLK